MSLMEKRKNDFDGHKHEMGLRLRKEYMKLKIYQ